MKPLSTVFHTEWRAIRAALVFPAAALLLAALWGWLDRDRFCGSVIYILLLFGWFFFLALIVRKSTAAAEDGDALYGSMPVTPDAVALTRFALGMAATVAGTLVFGYAIEQVTPVPVPALPNMLPVALGIYALLMAGSAWSRHTVAQLIVEFALFAAASALLKIPGLSLTGAWPDGMALLWWQFAAAMTAVAIVVWRRKLRRRPARRFFFAAFAIIALLPAAELLALLILTPLRLAAAEGELAKSDVKLVEIPSWEYVFEDTPTTFQTPAQAANWRKLPATVANREAFELFSEHFRDNPARAYADVFIHRNLIGYLDGELRASFLLDDVATFTRIFRFYRMIDAGCAQLSRSIEQLVQLEAGPADREPWFRAMLEGLADRPVRTLTINRAGRDPVGGFRHRKRLDGDWNAWLILALKTPGEYLRTARDMRKLQAGAPLAPGEPVPPAYRQTGEVSGQRDAARLLLLLKLRVPAGGSLPETAAELGNSTAFERARYYRTPTGATIKTIPNFSAPPDCGQIYQFKLKDKKP
jgi:predicted secreted protein